MLALSDVLNVAHAHSKQWKAMVRMIDHVCVKLIAFLEVGKGDEGNPRISDNGRH